MLADEAVAKSNWAFQRKYGNLPNTPRLAAFWSQFPVDIYGQLAAFLTGKHVVLPLTQALSLLSNRYEPTAATKTTPAREQILKG